jgi:hypothetical protein
MLLGGKPTHEDLFDARQADHNSKYFTDENFFVRNNLSEKYWLGGSISGVNRNGIHKNKTWLSGLALWMIPLGDFYGSHLPHGLKSSGLSERAGIARGD